MAKNTVVPPPPRVNFNPNDVASMAGAVRLLLQWVHDFYRATFVESGLLDPNFQATAGTFDPDDLPDPEETSIAKAQQTANKAYELAQQVKDSLDDDT